MITLLSLKDAEKQFASKWLHLHHVININFCNKNFLTDICVWKFSGVQLIFSSMFGFVVSVCLHESFPLIEEQFPI